jgi:hypothetical protein
MNLKKKLFGMEQKNLTGICKNLKKMIFIFKLTIFS